MKILLIVWCALSLGLFSVRAVLAQYDAPLPQKSTEGRPFYAQYDSEFSFAQDGAYIDVEPPLIEHDVVEQAEADVRQSFVATVVDDNELDSVLLFYRFSGETSFSRLVMMRVSYSSTYFAQIPTDPKSLKAIEYYIQASDVSGNRTVRGYTFSPLVRQVVPSANQVLVESSAVTNSPVAVPSAKKGLSGLPKLVYIIGGALVLGLIANAAKSSNGGSPDPVDGGECGPAGCRLTVTVNRPF